jgi:hypothetical protein
MALVRDLAKPQLEKMSQKQEVLMWVEDVVSHYRCLSL